MFFRKKIKLQDFLEGPFLGVVLQDGSFRYEDFYEEFHAVVKKDFPGTSEKTPGLDREYFTSSFLGAFLWLLKYRTLNANRNSPRKLAFLDLLFDIEMPGLIRRNLDAYDFDRVHEVYELMDIRCKEQYTEKLPKGEPPPFLASPIWDSNARPHPFKTAASVFIGLTLNANPTEQTPVSVDEPIVEELFKRFTMMTAPIEKEAAGVNFSWSTPGKADDSGQGSAEKGDT